MNKKLVSLSAIIALASTPTYAANSIAVPSIGLALAIILPALFGAIVAVAYMWNSIITDSN